MGTRHCTEGYRRAYLLWTSHCSHIHVACQSIELDHPHARWRLGATSAKREKRSSSNLHTGNITLWLKCSIVSLQVGVAQCMR